MFRTKRDDIISQTSLDAANFLWDSPLSFQPRSRISFVKKKTSKINNNFKDWSNLKVRNLWKAYNFNFQQIQICKTTKKRIVVLKWLRLWGDGREGERGRGRGLREKDFILENEMETNLYNVILGMCILHVPTDLFAFACFNSSWYCSRTWYKMNGGT